MISLDERGRRLKSQVVGTLCVCCVLVGELINRPTCVLFNQVAEKTQGSLVWVSKASNSVELGVLFTHQKSCAWRGV